MREEGNVAIDFLLFIFILIIIIAILSAMGYNLSSLMTMLRKFFGLALMNGGL